MQLSCRIQNQHTKISCILYINNRLSEREIKKVIPLTRTSKTIKCLGINLTKEVKDGFSGLFFLGWGVVFCVFCLFVVFLATPSSLWDLSSLTRDWTWVKKPSGNHWITREFSWKTGLPKTRRHWWKKLKKIQINEKVFHVHGLEELTLLKCPNYPK